MKLKNHEEKIKLSTGCYAQITRIFNSSLPNNEKSNADCISVTTRH